MGKVELNVTVGAELLANAESNGVTAEIALEERLRAAIARVDPHRPFGFVAAAEYQRRHSEEAVAKARQWAEENAAAIGVHNERIAERGLFGGDLRRW